MFDLDGTLVDSQRDLAEATNAVIVEAGGTPLSQTEIVSYVGEGAGVLVRRAMKAAGLHIDAHSALARFLVQYDARLTAHTRPYRGIPEVLDALRDAGVALAVLTNKPSRHTTRILDALELASKFTDVVGGDTTAGRKPDPAGLRQIMERAGVSPDRTVLVGDSPVDLHTARNAGTAICLAAYGFGYRFERQDFRGDERIVRAAGEILDVVLGNERGERQEGRTDDSPH